MNECLNMTEAEWSAMLLAEAKKHFKAPAVLITSRKALPRGITRIVNATVVVDINNETVLNALIKLSIDYEFEFLYSEANLQGELEVDYLTFQANMIAKLGD